MTAVYDVEGETVRLRHYNVEIAELMEATEGHSDPDVRALRKRTVQALKALHAAHAAAGPTRTTPPLDLTPAAVRSWATAHGYKVASQGRLRQDIVNAYVMACVEAHKEAKRG